MTHSRDLSSPDPQTVVLSKEAIITMMRAAVVDPTDPIRTAAMIACGIGCAARPGELFSLRCKDAVRSANGWSLLLRTEKSGESRVVVARPSLNQLLDVYSATHRPNPNEPFFSCSAEDFRSSVKHCLAAAGVQSRGGWHCLRHTGVSLMLEAHGAGAPAARSHCDFLAVPDVLEALTRTA